MEEWRITEALKMLRQCVTCPICGALVATEAGIRSHTNWHQGVTNKVEDINTKFQQIYDYIQTPVTGMEARMQQIRTDATNAIIADRNRLTSIEARLTALEIKVP